MVEPATDMKPITDRLDELEKEIVSLKHKVRVRQARLDKLIEELRELLK